MSFVKAIIGIVVAVVMVTAVLIPTIHNVDTTNDTNWGGGRRALFAMSTTFAIIGLVYAIAAAFGLV